MKDATCWIGPLKNEEKGDAMAQAMNCLTYEDFLKRAQRVVLCNYIVVSLVRDKESKEIWVYERQGFVKI
jgi:hypothetical protein